MILRFLRRRQRPKPQTESKSSSDALLHPPPQCPIHMASNNSPDDICAELLDNLDPELLVPLDLPSDVPFKPRLSEVKVQLFLRAIVKCAPLVGQPYIVKTVLATRGAAPKLQRLAGVWFNRIVFLGTFPILHKSTMHWDVILTGFVTIILLSARALYMPARSPNRFGDGILIDPVKNKRVDDFRNQVKRNSTTAGFRKLTLCHETVQIQSS